MTGVPTHLSPAFSPRDRRELVFLPSVNLKTGFILYWIDIVRPLLEHYAVRRLMEIGAWDGEHASLLLEDCEVVDSSLVVIEPGVRRLLRGCLEGPTHVQLIPERSHEALPQVSEAVDAVPLEGNLNYHTVLSDLRQVQTVSERCGAPFPIVFLRAVNWPYARRQMIPVSQQRRDNTRSSLYRQDCNWRILRRPERHDQGNFIQGEFYIRRAHDAAKSDPRLSSLRQAA